MSSGEDIQPTSPEEAINLFDVLDEISASQAGFLIAGASWVQVPSQGRLTQFNEAFADANDDVKEKIETIYVSDDLTTAERAGFIAMALTKVDSDRSREFSKLLSDQDIEFAEAPMEPDAFLDAEDDNQLLDSEEIFKIYLRNAQVDFNSFIGAVKSMPKAKTFNLARRMGHELIGMGKITAAATLGGLIAIHLSQKD